MDDDKGVFVEYGTNPALGAVRTLGELRQFTAYDHEIKALGGYWAMNLQKNFSLAQAEDWFQNGLGRRVVSYSQDGVARWRGFVNQVTINVGSTTKTRGPLVDVCNRALATYTPRDFSVYPPVDMSATTTLLADDAVSQGLYGIFEKNVAAGQTADATADKIRDVFIASRKHPKTTSAISITPGSVSTPAVTISCLGMARWLDQYIYVNLASGLSYLSAKLLAVITADPNGVISADPSAIKQNLYLVEDLEDGLATALEVINSLIKIGNDTDDRRRLWGIYDNEQLYYQTIPTAIEYEHKLSAPNQAINRYGAGGIVYPWEVRPGKWITVPDFLIGMNIPQTELQRDPRNAFIEGVRYTAPWTVELECGDSDTLAQILSKITYTGGIY